MIPPIGRGGKPLGLGGVTRAYPTDVPLRAESGRAKAYIDTECGCQPSVYIGVFGMELSHNSRGCYNDSDPAKLCGCCANASISVDVGLVTKLPDVRGIAAVHLERAGRRSKSNDEGVDILSDVLLAQT